jgi:hypothetical protein
MTSQVKCDTVVGQICEPTYGHGLEPVVRWSRKSDPKKVVVVGGDEKDHLPYYAEDLERDFWCLRRRSHQENSPLVHKYREIRAFDFQIVDESLDTETVTTEVMKEFARYRGQMLILILGQAPYLRETPVCDVCGRIFVLGTSDLLLMDHLLWEDNIQIEGW